MKQDADGFTQLRDADDVTNEMKLIIASVVEAYFQPDSGRLDTSALLDRIEEYTLSDGTRPDFGTGLSVDGSGRSTAVDAVIRYARQVRRELG